MYQRAAFAVFCSVILVGATSGSAEAAPLLDQENLVDAALGGQGIGCFDDISGDPDPNCTVHDRQDAQTFTVGITGLLTWIDVPVRQNVFTPNTEPVTLEIRAVIAGVPDSNDSAVLGSVSLPSSAFSGVDPSDPTTWPRYDVSGLGVIVHRGDVLAYSLRTSDSVGYLYNPELADTYPAGQAFRRNRPANVIWQPMASTDFLFRTFVDPGPVPAPALSSTSLVLVELLLISVAFFAIRRRQKGVGSR